MMSDANPPNANDKANEFPLQQNETMVGLGKRPRDASLDNQEEEEPQVQKARSQHDDGETSTLQQQQQQQQQDSFSHKTADKIVADNLEAYLADPETFAPRPEWYRPVFLTFLAGQKRPREEEDEPLTLVTFLQGQQPPSQQQQVRAVKSVATFGRECHSALHMAIRNHKPLAALDLIHHGANVNAENTKGVTPIMLACQKGMLDLVQELHHRRASLEHSSHSGTTPLLQASHFGHSSIVQFLIQQGASIQTSNHHNTTPLMRAAQEGHFEICSLLLQNGAEVNCLNTDHMSALLLASQRGHANVVQLLITQGKADLNATTQQDSTALMLACKRHHVSVVQVLLAAGCDLWIRDSRGRTAWDIAKRRENVPLLQLLDPHVQVELMQLESRKVRNLEIVKMWTLLQQERAHVALMHDQHVSIHDILHSNLLIPKGSKSALIQTMTLPVPLVELIASFLPLSRLWQQRIALIVKQCTVDPNAAIAASLEIIDDVLDEGGFVDACDAARVTPPLNCSSWREWKAWGCSFENKGEATSAAVARQPERQSVLYATLPWTGLGLFEMERPESAVDSTLRATGETPARSNESYVERRRGMCFLQILAHQTTMLARILSLPPYNMPANLIQKLITVSDVQSLSRRMGSQGVHFEASVAMEMLVLVNSVCAWYSGVRCREEETVGSPAQYRAYASLNDRSPSSAPAPAASDTDS